MWYFVVGILLGIWVYVDARGRSLGTWIIPILLLLMFTLWPLALPLYYALKPLRPGEERIILRMVAFVVIAAIIVSPVVTIIVGLIFPSARLDSASPLLVVAENPKAANAINIFFWPLALGVAYGLERWWRSRRLQPAEEKRIGCLHWPGVVASGFLGAIWASSAYSFLISFVISSEYLLEPAVGGPEMTVVRILLDARVIVTLVTLVAVIVLLGSRAWEDPTI